MHPSVALVITRQFISLALPLFMVCLFAGPARAERMGPRDLAANRMVAFLSAAQAEFYSNNGRYGLFTELTLTRDLENVLPNSLDLGRSRSVNLMLSPDKDSYLICTWGDSLWFYMTDQTGVRNMGAGMLEARIPDELETVYGAFQSFMTIHGRPGSVKEYCDAGLLSDRFLPVWRIEDHDLEVSMPQEGLVLVTGPEAGSKLRIASLAAARIYMIDDRGLSVIELAADQDSADPTEDPALVRIMRK